MVIISTVAVVATATVIAAMPVAVVPRVIARAKVNSHRRISVTIIGSGIITVRVTVWIRAVITGANTHAHTEMDAGIRLA